MLLLQVEPVVEGHHGSGQAFQQRPTSLEAPAVEAPGVEALLEGLLEGEVGDTPHPTGVPLRDPIWFAAHQQLQVGQRLTALLVGRNF